MLWLPWSHKQIKQQLSLCKSRKASQWCQDFSEAYHAYQSKFHMMTPLILAITLNPNNPTLDEAPKKLEAWQSPDSQETETPELQQFAIKDPSCHLGNNQLLASDCIAKNHNHNLRENCTAPIGTRISQHMHLKLSSAFLQRSYVLGKYVQSMIEESPVCLVEALGYAIRNIGRRHGHQLHFICHIWCWGQKHV